MKRIALLLGISGLVFSNPGLAFNFSWGDVDGSLDTTLSAGASWRAQDRDPDIVAKRSNGASLCPDPQNGEQTDDPLGDILGGCVLDAAEHQEFVEARGSFTQNADNGNLNYDRGDIVKSAAKLTSDLGLFWENFSVKGRVISFYDPSAVDFQEYHPDTVFQPEYTQRPKSVEDKIGFSNELELLSISSDWDVLDRTLSLGYGKQLIAWGESLTFVVHSINSVNAPNVIRLNTPGLDLKELFTPLSAFRASIDVSENVSMDAFYLTEWRPIEIPPIGDFFSTSDVAGAGNGYAMLSFGKEPEDPANLQDMETPPVNDGYAAYASYDGYCGFNQATSDDTDARGNEYDEDLLARFGPYKANIMEAGGDHGSYGRTLCMGNTQGAKDSGQWGVKFGYYAGWLNDTEFGFHYTRTHSRLPIASFIASELTNVTQSDLANPPSTGIGIVDGILGSLQGVIDTVVSIPDNLANATPQEAILGTGFAALFALNNNPDVNIEGDDAAVLGALAKVDTAGLFLEYPEDIDMFGLSFNTTVGDVSWSGEVAYRPDRPLQIHPVDLTLYALSPAFGTSRDVAARSFIEAYRAGVPYKTYWDGGEDASGKDFTPGDEFRANPGDIIHGYIRLPVANVSNTFLYATSVNPFGADQVILIGDVAATKVWDMPDKSVLQLSAPGDDNHAGIGRAQQDVAINTAGNACNTETNVLTQAVGSPLTGLLSDPLGTLTDVFGNASLFDFTCVPGVLNQTPNQEPLSTFADDFSWGFRVLSIMSYNNLIFGANYKQTLGAFFDVNGNSPGPGGDFVEGRKRFLWGSEFVKGDWAVNLKYNWFTGAGDRNLERDRDHYSMDIRYTF